MLRILFDLILDFQYWLKEKCMLVSQEMQFLDFGSEILLIVKIVDKWIVIFLFYFKNKCIFLYIAVRDGNEEFVQIFLEYNVLVIELFKVCI